MQSYEEKYRQVFMDNVNLRQTYNELERKYNTLKQQHTVLKKELEVC